MSLIQDPSTAAAANVKSASTAPVATDQALVVAVSPNSTATVVGEGTAGTPAGGVLSVQGVSGGTPIPVSASFSNADITNTGALGALNAAVVVTHPGLQSVGFQLAAGTLIGTIVAEVSFDGGTTWNASFFDSPSTGNIVSSIVFGSANAATAATIVGVGGAGETRVRVSAYSSGTANLTVRASDIQDPSQLSGGAAGSAAPPVIQQVGGSDGTNLRAMATDTSGHPVIVGSGTAGTPASGVVSVQGISGGQTLPVTASQATAANFNATVVQGAGSGAAATYWYVRVTDGTNTMPTMDTAGRAGFQHITDGTNTAAVKAASTAAAAADPSLVVALSPNSPLPAGSNALGSVTVTGTATISGTVTANQGTANTVANSWPTEITDGTHGPVAVKAASTAAAAADPSLVTAFSPNSPLPTGTNSIGTVNQGTAASVANSWTTEITDGTHGPAAVKAASTAAAAADPSLVVALSPNSPLPSGTNSIGAVTQATAANLNATVVQGAGSGAAATFWYVRVTDGTNTMPTMDTAGRAGFQHITDGTNTAAVKAASTAAAATDPALVVTIGPNTPLPSGTNIIGALSANQSVNLAQVAGTTTVTGGVAGSQGVGGLAATGAALAGNPVLVAGSDGTDARNLATDTSGRQIVVGAAAAGAAAVGNPVETGAVYNTTSPAPANGNIEPLQGDQAGNLLVFQGSDYIQGAAWNNGTAVNTVQYQTGTATIGQLLGAPAVYVQLDMTTTLTGGVVTFEGTFDGTNWTTIPAGNVLNPQSYVQVANPYTFVASTQTPILLVTDGYVAVRARLSTVITGTGSVTPYWSTRSQPITDLPVSEQTAYGANNQAITITLTTLASAAQRGSTAVNNTTTVYKDALVQVLVQSNAAGTSATGIVNVYAYASSNGGTNYTDGVSGTDGAVTLTSPPNVKLIGTINVVANATIYTGGPYSVAAVFGGRLPNFWGIVVENKSGAALGATAADNKAFYQGVG